MKYLGLVMENDGRRKKRMKEKWKHVLFIIIFISLGGDKVAAVDCSGALTRVSGSAIGADKYYPYDPSNPSKTILFTEYFNDNSVSSGCPLPTCTISDNSIFDGSLNAAGASLISQNG